MPEIDKLYYSLGLRDEDFTAGMKRAGDRFSQLDVSAQRAGGGVGTLENGMRSASRAMAENTAVTVAGTHGMGAWSALQAEAAGHVGEHTFAMSRLERAFEEFAAHATGTNRVLALLASTASRFALGGVETAAILGGVAAIAALYEHMTAAAKEAQKAHEELINSLEKSNADAALGPDPELVKQTNAQRDQLRQEQSRRRLLLNFGVSPDDDRILELDRQIKKDQEELTAGENRLAKARLDATTPLQTVVTKARDLTAELEKQQAAIQAFKTAIAAQVGGETKFDDQVAVLVEGAKKAHVGAQEIARQVAELRAVHAGALKEASNDLSKEMQAELVKTTGLQADALKGALAEFNAKINTAITRGEPVDLDLARRLREAKEQAIPLAEAADRLRADLTQIDHDTSQGFGFIQAAKKLNEDLAQAEADFASAKSRGDEPGMEAAEQRRLTITARIKTLQDQIEALLAKQRNETNSISQTVQNIAGGIAAVANTAFGLASAFAGANSELAKMLGGVGEVAGGVSALLAAANKKDDKTGIAPGLGGLLSSTSGLLQAAPAIGQIIGGAIGLASSLFGKSPEEQARLQALKENNERLRELSEHVGDLAKINVQGTDLAKFTKLLSDPRFNTVRGEAGSDIQNRDIGAILASFGITTAELQQFADQFNHLKIGTGAGGKITIDDINALIAALQNSKLNQFADDFTGQMQRMDAEIQIFSLQKPIQQFEEFRKVLGSIQGGTGALGNLLQGLDLTTAAGLDAAQQAVQALFTQFQSLSGDQLAAFLQGLSSEDFVNAIEKLTGIINAQAGSGAVAGTGGFNVDRSITEVTGSRLAALLDTDTMWNAQTAANTAKLVDLFSGVAPPLISPPAISDPTAGAAARGDSFQFDVTINFTGVPDAPAAKRSGELVSDAMLEEINRKLGTKLRLMKRSRGLVAGQ